MDTPSGKSLPVKWAARKTHPAPDKTLVGYVENARPTSIVSNNACRQCTTISSDMIMGGARVGSGLLGTAMMRR